MELNKGWREYFIFLDVGDLSQSLVKIIEGIVDLIFFFFLTFVI